MFRIIVDGDLVEICMYNDYSEAKKYAIGKYSEFTDKIIVEKCKQP